jgi:MFS family permease
MNKLNTFIQKRFPLVAESQGFRNLWLATFITSLGDWLGFVALNLYVFNLTGSAMALAGLLAMEAVPAMLIGPFAGVIVDRFRRRQVMIITNMVAMTTFLLLPFTTELWHIYVLALVARTTATFHLPAERALIPDLIGKDRIINANAALGIIQHLTLIIGPAIAGALVAASSASVAFIANAITFLIAAFFVSRITGEIPRTRTPEEAEAGWLDDLKVGLRYATGNKAARSAVEGL